MRILARGASVMRTFVSTPLFAAAVAALTLVSSRGTAEDQKVDEKRAAAMLEGGYTLVSGEKDGKGIPEERIQGSVVRFTSNTIVGTDKDKKEFFASSYTLDTSKTPWVITMKSTSPTESTAVGIIKKEGDTLTIAYALPGGETPAEFKTKEKQHLFVLKAVSNPPNKFTKD